MLEVSCFNQKVHDLIVNLLDYKSSVKSKFMQSLTLSVHVRDGYSSHVVYLFVCHALILEITNN